MLEFLKRIVKNITRFLKNRLFITVVLLSLSLYVLHQANVNEITVQRRKRSSIKSNEEASQDNIASSKTTNFQKESKQACTLPEFTAKNYNGETNVEIWNKLKTVGELKDCLNNVNEDRNENKFTRDLKGRIIIQSFDIETNKKLNSKCCYSVWERHEKKLEIISRKGVCTPIKKNQTRVSDEIISISCSENGISSKKKKSSKYNNETLLFHVPLKSSIETKIRKIERKMSRAAMESRIKIQIIGLNSLSRLAFHRILPQSTKFLRETLNAVEFLGHNTLGTGSLENIIPLLTGRSLQQVRENCRTNKKCDIIWTRLVKSGYRVGFAEDTKPNENRIMDVLGKMASLKTVKPDYYIPYQFSGSSSTFPINPSTNKIPTKVNNLTCNDLDKVSKLFENTLKTAMSFNESNTMYFQFTWSSLLTQRPNNLLKHLDSILLQTLESFQNEKVHSNTVLLVMTTHGSHEYGQLLNQSSTDENTPAFFFVFPFSLRSKYQTALSNLHINSRQLTTNWDIYETLKDLVDLREVGNAGIFSRMNDGKDLEVKRGMSLFLPLPQRNCASAGIPPENCRCQSKNIETISNKANNNNKNNNIGESSSNIQKRYFQAFEKTQVTKEITEYAKDVVHDLNRKISNASFCSPLQLLSVHGARIGGNPKKKYSKSLKSKGKSTESKWRWTQSNGVIKLETMPGNGIFEVIVQINNYTITPTAKRKSSDFGNENKPRVFVKHVEIFRPTTSSPHNNNCKMYSKSIKPFCHCTKTKRKDVNRKNNKKKKKS